METNETFAALSDNEHVIRSYRCTKLKPLFGKPSIGYLSITNKRLVYHSEAHTATKSDAIISEIPLNDVGGISTFIGQSFSLIQFLLFSAALYFGTMFLSNLLPKFLTDWVFSIILILPYLVGLLFEKNIINKDIGDRIIQNLEGTSLDSILKKKNSTFYMGVFKILFLVGMALFAWNLVNEPRLARQGGLFNNVILLGAYFVIYILTIGRNRSFGLQVASKTSGSSGIKVQGNSFVALFSKNNNPGQTINANPAEDAEAIARDLGAIVLDIQQLGDLGIQKWSLY